MFKEWDKVKMQDGQKWIIVDIDNRKLHPYLVMIWVDSVDDFDEYNNDMLWYKWDNLTLISRQLDIEFYGKYF